MSLGLASGKPKGNWTLDPLAAGVKAASIPLMSRPIGFWKEKLEAAWKLEGELTWMLDKCRLHPNQILWDKNRRGRHYKRLRWELYLRRWKTGVRIKIHIQRRLKKLQARMAYYRERIKVLEANPPTRYDLIRRGDVV